MPKQKGGNGAGSVYQRCDKCSRRMEKGKCPECGGRKGRWLAIASLGWVVRDGKRVRDRKTIYGATQTEVQNELNKVLAAKSSGELASVSERMTVAEYMAYWLDHRKAMMEANPDKFRPRTYHNYVTHSERYILPALGPIRLGELSADEIDRLYAGIIKRGHNRTALMVHQVLHAALAHAVKRQKLRHNPASHAHKPEYESRERAVLTVEQCEALIRDLRPERIYALYVLMIYSGVRRAEACGLRWRDVEWEDGAISIEQVAEQIGQEVIFTPPKTKKSRRTIPLPPAAVVVLRDHRRRQAEERLRAGEDWQDHDLVFCRQDGSPIVPNFVSRRWNKLRGRLGLPDVTPHDLRHTYITILIEAGGDYKTASDLAGHSSINLTLNRYAHTTNKMKTGAIERLSAVLPSADAIKNS